MASLLCSPFARLTVCSRRMAGEISTPECSTSITGSCRAPLHTSNRVLDRRRRLILRPCKLQSVPPRLTIFNRETSASILEDGSPKNILEPLIKGYSVASRGLRTPSGSFRDSDPFLLAWHELRHTTQKSISFWPAVFGLGLVSTFATSASAAPSELQQTASATLCLSVKLLSRWISFR